MPDKIFAGQRRSRWQANALTPMTDRRRWRIKDEASCALIAAALLMVGSPAGAETDTVDRLDLTGWRVTCWNLHTARADCSAVRTIGRVRWKVNFAGQSVRFEVDQRCGRETLRYQRDLDPRTELWPAPTSGIADRREALLARLRAPLALSGRCPPPRLGAALASQIANLVALVSLMAWSDEAPMPPH